MITRSPLDAIERDFNDLVRRVFTNGAAGRAPAERPWIPPTDVFMADGQIHVRLECPGLDADNDVDIEVGDGRLVIRGRRRSEHETEGRQYWHRELTFGEFERTIALPQGVDTSAVTATYDAGILEVSAPLPSAQTSKVKVQVGAAQTKELE